MWRAASDGALLPSAWGLICLPPRLTLFTGKDTMRLAIFALAAAAVAAAPLAGITPPSSCDGQPNSFPVTSPATSLVGSYGKGSRYSLEGTNVSILQLRGSPYEMGQQYGALLRSEINQVFPDMYAVSRGVAWRGKDRVQQRNAVTHASLFFAAVHRPDDQQRA